MKKVALRSLVVALALASAGIAAGCQAGASPAPLEPPLSVSTGTSIPVTLVVNGSVVETVAPGGRQDPITATLPALPWTVETRSPSGRVLSTLTVSAHDPIGNGFGRAVRVDLSCGRLDVWSGAPLLGGTFIPGPSGDCD
ncbi:MAG: hypothetical protein ABSG37_06560 [Candidatus Limnocylindrales bacterium]|jgi:hypothetical protein